MQIDSAVLEQVSNELQAYVYMLVDPSTGVPFYIGKGRGLRHAAHVNESLVPFDERAHERTAKQQKIRELLDDGLEPEVWMLRYGLRPSEYTAVEASAIDLLMTFPMLPIAADGARVPLGHREQLTNARREEARGHGITPLRTLVEEFAAPKLRTETPLLLITLNGWTDRPDGERVAGGRMRFGAGYRSEWLVSSVRQSAFQQIGESASAWWSLSPKQVQKRGITHVAAMHRGVTRALVQVEPDSWEVKTTSRVDNRGRPIKKAAFWFSVVDSGPLFDEVVGPFGHRVPGRSKGQQNAIYYWPRG